LLFQPNRRNKKNKKTQESKKDNPAPTESLTKLNDTIPKQAEQNPKNEVQDQNSIQKPIDTEASTEAKSEPDTTIPVKSTEDQKSVSDKDSKNNGGIENQSNSQTVDLSKKVPEAVKLQEENKDSVIKTTDQQNLSKMPENNPDLKLSEKIGESLEKDAQNSAGRPISENKEIQIANDNPIPKINEDPAKNENTQPVKVEQNPTELPKIDNDNNAQSVTTAKIEQENLSAKNTKEIKQEVPEEDKAQKDLSNKDLKAQGNVENPTNENKEKTGENNANSTEPVSPPIEKTEIPSENIQKAEPNAVPPVTVTKPVEPAKISTENPAEVIEKPPQNNGNPPEINQNSVQDTEIPVDNKLMELPTVSAENTILKNDQPVDSGVIPQNIPPSTDATDKKDNPSNVRVIKMETSEQNIHTQLCEQKTQEKPAEHQSENSNPPAEISHDSTTITENSAKNASIPNPPSDAQIPKIEENPLNNPKTIAEEQKASPVVTINSSTSEQNIKPPLLEPQVKENAEKKPNNKNPDVQTGIKNDTEIISENQQKNDNVAPEIKQEISKNGPKPENQVKSPEIQPLPTIPPVVIDKNTSIIPVKSEEKRKDEQTETIKPKTTEKDIQAQLGETKEEIEKKRLEFKKKLISVKESIEKNIDTNLNTYNAKIQNPISNIEVKIKDFHSKSAKITTLYLFY